jgi:Cyclin, N-terminal domain
MIGMEDLCGSAYGYLEALTLQESRYWQSFSMNNPYQSSLSRTEFSRNANERWRIKMCQWYFEVVDCFDFDRGVVSIALNYLDRMVAESLCNKTFTSKNELQLVAITSLYVALKLHGEIEHRGGRYRRKKLTIDAFVILCKHQFDVSAIESMERALLSILNWHLNPPDVRSYVACMLELMPERKIYSTEWRYIFGIARYIGELSLGESSLAFQVRPSVTACAAILCAIHSLQESGRPLPPAHVLEVMSDNIAAATALRLDMPAVTHVAIRLMHLCPSIIANQRIFDSTCDNEMDGVSNDEIMNDTSFQRKASPVCVSSFSDENAFFVSARERN